MSRIVVLDPRHPSPEPLAELRRHLDRSGVVALPTDTIYGLAANALDPVAVERVFQLKGREAGKPLPVVVRDRRQAAELALDLPPEFAALAERFWPGPLTLVVSARPHLPPVLTAGSGTVAMRQPDLALLADLLALFGYPLTSTSANRSGELGCRSAAEVESQLGRELEWIVDGGVSPGAVPSTIVDLSAGAPRVLRAGAIPVSEVEAALG